MNGAPVYLLDKPYSDVALFRLPSIRVPSFLKRNNRMIVTDGATRSWSGTAAALHGEGGNLFQDKGKLESIPPISYYLDNGPLQHVADNTNMNPNPVLPLQDRQKEIIKKQFYDRHENEKAERKFKEGIDKEIQEQNQQIANYLYNTYGMI